MMIVVFLLAIAAGLANPLQGAANSELNKQLAQPMWAALSVYSTGFAGLLLVQLFVRQPFPSGQIAGVSWWAWCGGLVSLLPTLSGLLFTQKLGSGVFTAVSLTASMSCSVVLDHFGWLGLHKHVASPLRIAGCGLLIAGLWLVAKF